MFTVQAIGNIGSDAIVRSESGNEFVSFRIAHTSKWTDSEGHEHSKTQWIDCVMNGKPKVLEWLKRGQLVYISGSAQLRVYSSAKDRCMKAGVQVSVRQLELLGNAADVVPRYLFDADGVRHDVQKYFNTEVHSAVLYSMRGDVYNSDENGWISVADSADTSDSGKVQE